MFLSVIKQVKLLFFFFFNFTADENLGNERIEEQLLGKLLAIVQIINDGRCNLPQMPDQNNADFVFNTNYQDAQPYLYRV